MLLQDVEDLQVHGHIRQGFSQETRPIIKGQRIQVCPGEAGQVHSGLRQIRHTRGGLYGLPFFLFSPPLFYA